VFMVDERQTLFGMKSIIGIEKMNLEQAVLPGDIIKVKLSGSLDIAGAGQIDQPFAAITAKNNRVIVDFSNVSFLASIGIRILVKAARAIGSRGGRLVVYNLNPDARKVLRSTGIDAIIPTMSDEASAIAECCK
jgi:anti-anti-sigma factor